MLNRLIDLILLSAVCFLCCVPVFTIGASITALYDVTMNYALQREVGIVAPFFRAFARNFKKATALFFVFAALGVFLFADMWGALHWESSFQFVFIVVILAVTLFYVAVVSHVFPVLAYFDLSVKECIRKAFVLSMKNGVYTVFIMVMDLLPVLLILIAPAYFGQILFFWFILGLSLTAYLNSLHMVRLFDPDAVKEAGDIRQEQETLRDEERKRRENEEDED